MINTSINGIPDCAKISFILRHAERDHILSMSSAFDAMLTEKGKADARRLGAELSRYSPLRVYSSPVTRCIQTAEEIRSGITAAGGAGACEGPLYDLGGPYIRGDWADVSRQVEEAGHAVFIRKWFDGELPAGLMVPFEEAAHVQMQILIGQLMDSDPRSAVNVTHDWNIMLLREYFFRLAHDSIGIPPFLDGMAAFIPNGRIRIVYHDESVEMPVNR